MPTPSHAHVHACIRQATRMHARHVDAQRDTDTILPQNAAFKNKELLKVCDVLYGVDPGRLVPV